MAVTKLNDFSSGDANLEAIMSSLNNAYKGMHQVTDFSFTSSGLPLLGTGSVFDANGSIYILTSNEQLVDNPSIPNGATNCYLIFDGDTETFSLDDSSYLWSASKQGFYNGNKRALFVMTKESSTQFPNKKPMLNRFGENAAYWYDQNLREIDTPYFPGLSVEESNGRNKYLHGTYDDGDIFDQLLATWEGRVGDYAMRGALRQVAAARTLIVSKVEPAVFSGGVPTRFNIYFLDITNLTADQISVQTGGSTSYICSISW